jgi:hypothetical protein
MMGVLHRDALDLEALPVRHFYDLGTIVIGHQH